MLKNSQLRYLRWQSWEPELPVSRSHICFLVYLLLIRDTEVLLSWHPLMHALTAGSRQSSLLFSCDQQSGFVQWSPPGATSNSMLHQIRTFRYPNMTLGSKCKRLMIKHLYARCRCKLSVWHLTNTRDTNLMNRIINACILAKTPNWV